MNRLRLRVVFFALVVLVASYASAAIRHARVVDDNDLVIKPGNVHQFARPELDRGPADPDMRYDKMILVLPRSAQKQAELDQLIAEQHDPMSANYHRWLTPEEFGQRFGMNDDDLGQVTGWLQRSGFQIDEVAPGRGWVNFSGTVRDVERVFRTQIHNYEVDGKMYHANVSSPAVPRALADLVDGVVSLHNFPRKAMNHGIKHLDTEVDASHSERKTVPQYTSGTSHYIAPADFATIYDVNALYSAGINGTGQTIAIVGRTDIALADVQYFRSYFGLVANDPVFVHNGTDPGVVDSGEEGEADLDVEWSGAVAPNATIKFVITKSTSTTDGVDLSAQYIVNNNVAKIMSTSFGQCESQMGTTENTFYNNLWSQGASAGITAFVSSGDAGAAGCNGGSDTSGSGAAISGLASTPYNVAVGGTQFADTTSPSTYWSTTNNTTTKGSALSYIPEVAWNESANVSGGDGLWASAGGKSTIYAKPTWQTGTGVPADGKRDIPDVSLTAAGHDGYLVIQGHTSSASGLGAVGGTSASSPSFSGLMALINQKTGTSWGNANTKFYALAAAQRAGTAPAMFHDVTSGNNSVPGVTGFTCGTGYDAVTGLGTVDAALLVNNFSGTATPDFTLAAAPTSVSVVQGNSGNSTITTAVSGGFSSAVALTATGAPSGTTVSFSPASIAAPGSGTSTMTIAVGTTTTAGTYTITVTGTGGSKTHTATVTLTVTAASNPDFAISASPTAVSVAKGSNGTSTISTSVSGGFSSAVALTSSGAPSGTTVSFSPASIAAPGSGSSTMTLAVGSSTANGTYTITVTGTGGSKTHTATVTLTVTTAATPDFAISASPTSVSVQQAHAGTSTISTTVSGGFSSAVALTSSGAPSGTTVAFSPTSIAAPGSGSSTMTITVGSTTAVGNYTITVTGTGGSKTHTATVALTVTSGTINPQQLIVNGGFETGTTPWTASSGVIDNSTGEAAHTGSYKAWMDGYGSTHTDSILQTVTIPSTVTSATLAFYLHVDTAETTTSTAYDTLKVQIRNSSGTVLATLGTFSNLSHNTGYALQSYNVLAYKGQTIQVYMVGAEDSSLQTSFVVDDVTLNVQ